MIASLKASVIIALFVLVICLGGWLGYRYERNDSRADAAESRAEAAAQDASQAETVTENVMKTVSIINTISQAVTDEKQQNSEESTTRARDIRQAVKDDGCAVKPVPAVATERLRAHRNKIRTRSADTTSGKPHG